MERNSAEPIIVLDIARHRIRIHRSTLSRLNNPEFVQLLVNPDRKGIVMASCEETAQGAHQLKQTAKRHSLEMFSPSLVEEIYMCAGFSQLKPVTLSGRQIRGRDAVFFPLRPNNDPEKPRGAEENG